MRKKRIIILSVILSVFAVMIVLASTVFMLSKVQVNFLSTGNSVISESDAEGIVKSGKFSYGKNVLFMKFDKQIERIEKAYPYVKVEKIERKFPNRAIVHISERTPAAHVRSGQYVYVLDAELKVLNVVYADDYNAANTSLPESAKYVPEINQIEIASSVSAGDKLVNEKMAYILSSICEGMEKAGKNLIRFSNILVEYDEANLLTITISFDETEKKLVIMGVANLTRKVLVGIVAYDKDGHATGSVVQQNANDSETFVWQA